MIKDNGAEILRLWVAMSDFREELRVGKQILARVVEAYRKFRNTLRYLVSNLYDFDPAADQVAHADLAAIDRAVLSRYGAMAAGVIDGYRRYDYPAIFQAVNQFLTVDLSAFYADVSKDRLYTLAPDSAERRSAQTAMYIMADGLARLLAAILPVTCEELWRHLPADAGAAGPGPRSAREDSVHLARFPADVEAFIDPALDAAWARLRDIRDDVNRALEAARQAKVIGTSLQAAASLTVGGEAEILLRKYRQRPADAVHRVPGRAGIQRPGRRQRVGGAGRRRQVRPLLADRPGRRQRRTQPGAVQPMRRCAPRPARTRGRVNSDESTRGNGSGQAAGRTTGPRAVRPRRGAGDRRHRDRRRSTGKVSRPQHDSAVWRSGRSSPICSTSRTCRTPAPPSASSMPPIFPTSRRS